MAGRPREFDREAALIAARNLFWRHGYEGTSMADLVAEMGIASARIYHAFGSKEQLFREAVGNYADNEGGFAVAALQQANILAAVSALFSAAIALYTRNIQPLGCMVVSAAGGLSEDNDSLREWLAQQRQQRTQGIIDRFIQAAAQRELAAEADPLRLGHFYATFLHGLSVQARDGVSPQALTDAAALALWPLQNSLRRD